MKFVAFVSGQIAENRVMVNADKVLALYDNTNRNTNPPTPKVFIECGPSGADGAATGPVVLGTMEEVANKLHTAI